MAWKPPDLLKFQLPAAVLASLAHDSRLTVSRESKDDGQYRSSLVISQGADNALEKEHPLQIDETQDVDWYRCETSKEKTPANKKRLHHIGTTSHKYILTNKGTRAKPKLDTSTSNLKRIGEQTRKLLDEERKKRKEIVRLDEGELPLPPEAIANEVAVAKSLQDEVKDKKIPPESKKKPRTNKRKRNDPTIDSFMPNIHHLSPNAATKEDKSNLLRLHGLPIGVRASDIRKFFHGLNPTIFALPTFDGYIDGWDGNVSEKECKKAKVKRYPESFRVYVKFQSVLVADAAMERSGESMGFDKKVNECCERGVFGATVALSTVSKPVAKFLEKHLAISIRRNEALSKSLSSIETQIGREVSNLAWIMAANKLKLDFRHAPMRHDKPFYHHHTIPRNTAQYNALIKVYNQLIDEHETIERETGLLLMHTFDPSCIEHSAHRITQSVSNWLLDEIGVIEKNLREARVRFIRDDVCPES